MFSTHCHRDHWTVHDGWGGGNGNLYGRGVTLHVLFLQSTNEWHHWHSEQSLDRHTVMGQIPRQSKAVLKTVLFYRHCCMTSCSHSNSKKNAWKEHYSTARISKLAEIQQCHLRALSQAVHTRCGAGDSALLGPLAESVLPQHSKETAPRPRKLIESDQRKTQIRCKMTSEIWISLHEEKKKRRSRTTSATCPMWLRQKQNLHYHHHQVCRQATVYKQLSLATFTQTGSG